MPRILFDFFKENVAKFPNKPVIETLEKDKIRKVTYREMANKVNALTASLQSMGIKKGDRVILLSENREEWFISLYAVFKLGAVAVPLYTTASKENHEYIIKDSKPSFVIVSTKKFYENLKNIIEPLNIRSAVFSYSQELYENNDLVFDYNELIKDHSEKPKSENIDVDQSDKAVFIYTSGTTGEPKGVVLTHGNIFNDAVMLHEIPQSLSSLRYLSMLPLSHAYEFTVINTILSLGGTIIPVNNIGKVLNYIDSMSPTISCAVPRLFEKIYTNVIKSFEKQSPFIKLLFKRGLTLGKKVHRYVEKGETIPFPDNIKFQLYDKLIFSKIRNSTLKTVELFVSGGAAIMPEIIEFFTTIGVTIVEGYGISECSPVVSCNKPEDRDIGTVGEPLKGLQVKICKDGELIVKGPIVMDGYYNKPEDTSEAIDNNGFFHTGDLAVWTDNKKIKIIGRKKEIIVMANGKNIAPAKIENMLAADEFIDTVCVIGDERKYLSALIIPDFDAIRKYAREKEYHFTDIEDLASHPGIRKLIGRRISEVNKKIESYEAIKEFVILSKPLSVETGELTPTLKLKRNVVKKRFSELIETMYS